MSGEVTGWLQDTDTKEVEWEIPTFLSLSAVRWRWYKSASFRFAGESWRLRVFPGGDEYAEDGFISLLLERVSEAECSAQCMLGLRLEDGRVEEVASECLAFGRGRYAKWFHDFYRRDTLEQRGSELLPSGVLTLVCRLMKAPRGMTKAVSMQSLVSAQGSADFVEASTQTRSEESPSACSACNEEDSKEIQSKKGIQKLSDDLSGLMLSGDDSDISVFIRGEEFHLHRSILGVRAPDFRSALDQCTTEHVSLDTCEPDTFRLFVRFLYSGRMEERFSPDAVSGLLALADTYGVGELKSACSDVISRALSSSDTFCGAVALAATYDLENLLEEAANYFSRNTIDVIQTAEWMDFMKEHAAEANEIHLKALLQNRSSQ